MKEQGLSSGCRDNLPTISYRSVFFQVRLDDLHVHSISYIRVGFQCRSEQVLVSWPSGIHELCVLKVIISQSGNFTSLPVIVTLVKCLVQGKEEEQPICQQTPLVHISPLRRVSSLYHYKINLINYFKSNK